MALATLVGGADCGPSNPLTSLVKTFQHDRSLQQDRYVPVASSSRATLRTQRQAAADADAARFFEPGRAAAADLTATDRAIAPVSHVPRWATDFAAHPRDPRLAPEDDAAFSPAFLAPGVPQWASDFAMSTQVEQDTLVRATAGASPRHYSSPAPHFHSRYAPSPLAHHHAAAQAAMVEQHAASQAQWEHAFVAQQHEAALAQAMATSARDAEALYRPRDSSTAHTDDDLARTAGELLETVSQDQSDKFAKSSFMELMRKLRDREVAVEGNKVVEQLGPAPMAAALDKGKGRAHGASAASAATAGPTGYHPRRRASMTDALREMRLSETMADGYAEMQEIWDDEYRQREAREQRRPFQGDGGAIAMRSEEDLREAISQARSSSWEEDFDAAGIVGGPPAVQFRPRSPEHAPTAQQMEWDKLQADWDDFEATNVGIERVHPPSEYKFRPHNPYLRQVPTRQHQIHSHASPLDSVLMKEAEAQLNPRDPQAWFDLGVKQQENEREDLAIQALQTAVAISPAMHDAWLALAVSYTNENDRTRAYDAIEMWAGCRYEYADAVNAFRNKVAALGRSRTLAERHAELTEMLINMARLSHGEEELDADVQIALGVLFNTSEEYDKAGDCFAAAMSVRPDDPLLFNRLGATLANSGRSEEAVRFYFKALELQPSYARARYNLAISCINMGSYQEAAEHLLSALSLQEEDVQLARSLDESDEASASGVLTSSTLWDTLHMSMSMLGRSDLTSACERQDLSAFRDGSFTF